MTMFHRILPFAFSLLALPAVATAAPKHHEAQRPDGSTVNWTLDLPDGGERGGLIVIAQGSGCAAAMQSRSMQQVRAAFGNLAALTVEKYGVQPGDNPTDDHLDARRGFANIIRFPNVLRTIAR